jgi:hypothetical protein
LNTRRIAGIVAGLGLLVSASMGVAGCHSSGSGAQSDADVKGTLVGSLSALSTTSYAISLTTPRISAVGSVDPVSDVIAVTAKGKRLGQPATFQALAIAQDSWAKINIGSQGQQMGINPAKWLSLDPTKLSAGSLPFDQAHPSDAFDLRDIMAGIISVKQADAQHFSGAIDLTGLRGVTSFLPAGSSLGSGAKAVPFVATVDPQGRLIDFKVGGGTGHTYAFDLKISDYSAAALAEPPDDVDVVAAPSAAYTLLRTEHFLTAGN